MKDYKLKAKDRKIFGRKVKQIRKEGLLPANVFGKDIKSKAISIDSGEFKQTFDEAGETNVVNVVIGKQTIPTLIHNVQSDPVSDIPIHVDFIKVDLKKKTTANVPIEIEGESPAVQQGLGTLVEYVDEVEVEALPTNMPNKIVADISSLDKVDSALFVKDLPVKDKDTSILNDPEQMIIKIEEVTEEEEPTPSAEEESVEGEGTETEEVKEDTKGETKQEKSDNTNAPDQASN